MTPLSVLTHTFTGYHQAPSTQKHTPPSTRVTAVPSPASATLRCRGCGGGRDPVVRKQRAGASVFSVRGARGIPVLPPVPLRQGKQPRPGPVCLPWPRPQCECSCSAAGRCGTFAPEPDSPRRQHPDATPRILTDPHPPLEGTAGSWAPSLQRQPVSRQMRPPSPGTIRLPMENSRLLLRVGTAVPQPRGRPVCPQMGARRRCLSFPRSSPAIPQTHGALRTSRPRRAVP